jgi:hypothetical protein
MPLAETRIRLATEGVDHNPSEQVQDRPVAVAIG